MDDAVASSFEPLTTARPFGELLHGCLTFRERWERAFRLGCSGQVGDPTLVDFDEPGCTPCVGLHDIDTKGGRWFVASRFAVGHPLPEGLTGFDPDGPSALVNDGRIVAVRALTSRSHQGVRERIGAPADSTEAAVEVPGRWIDAVWELMSENARQTRQDLEALFPGPGSSVPDGVEILGPGPVSLGERVLFEPGVVLDTREGAIRIDDEVTIKAFTRLAGPSYIGPGSVVFGGTLSAVSLGPVCKVRGEIETTVIAGYSNKAHDGFLGHAYLGRWVNLGALTTNSDLKNNYGSVRLRLPDGDIDTGEAKVGCFLGDHVKTGIGTMLNTGTLIGVGSNVFGGLMPPAYVPAFSWGAGHELSPYRLDTFLSTAERVMARRDVALTQGLRTVLSRVWEGVHGSR